MERSFLMLVIAMTAVWLILDDFVGRRRVSAFVQMVMEDSGGFRLPSSGDLARMSPTPGNPNPPKTEPGRTGVIEWKIGGSLPR